MALVADEGLGLFCGLNAMPKKSFLSEDASRITPEKVSLLLVVWHARFGETLLPGKSLNLDFHSVPYFGEHPVVQSLSAPQQSAPAQHPRLSRLGRRQSGVLLLDCRHPKARKQSRFRFIELWTRQ